jgi:hypothetical protein
LPVDEKGWGSVDAAAYSSGEIGAHTGLKLLRLQRLKQLSGGKLQRLSQLYQEVIVETTLILIKQIVHLPELFVSGGKFRGFGRRLRIWMYLGQRKVAKDKRQALAKMLLQTFDDGIGLPARGALVVPILYQRARRILISLPMILGADGDCELRHT